MPLWKMGPVRSSNTARAAVSPESPFRPARPRPRQSQPTSRREACVVRVGGRTPLNINIGLANWDKVNAPPPVARYEQDEWGRTCDASDRGRAARRRARGAWRGRDPRRPQPHGAPGRRRHRSTSASPAGTVRSDPSGGRLGGHGGAAAAVAAAATKSSPIGRVRRDRVPQGNNHDRPSAGPGQRNDVQAPEHRPRPRPRHPGRTTPAFYTGTTLPGRAVTGDDPDWLPARTDGGWSRGDARLSQARQPRRRPERLLPARGRRSPRTGPRSGKPGHLVATSSPASAPSGGSSWRGRRRPALLLLERTRCQVLTNGSSDPATTPRSGSTASARHPPRSTPTPTPATPAAGAARTSS